MPRFVVIVNKDSGTARKSDPREIGVTVREVMDKHGVETDIRICAGAEIEDSIKSAISENPDVIVMAGGDGTVNTAAGLMENAGIALGILPMGTFNLAARDYGVPLEIEAALSALATAGTEKIQLMKINGRPCLCTAIIGFYPRMARMIDEYHGKKWWRKSLRIVGWSISRFARSTVYQVNISGSGPDGKIDRLFKSRMLAVVPGSYRDTLGIIPERVHADGKEATVYVFRHLTRLAMLRGMLVFLLGKSKDDPDMREVSISEAVLDFQSKKHVKIMIDGEVTQLDTPLRIELIPEALQLLRPRSNRKT